MTLFVALNNSGPQPAPKTALFVADPPFSHDLPLQPAATIAGPVLAALTAGAWRPPR